MAKPLQKPARPTTESQPPPDLTLVESAADQKAAPKKSQAEQPRQTTSHVWRDLHPARVWPD